MMASGPTGGNPLLDSQMAATLTAEIAAALAHQAPGYVYDDDEEDELEEDQYDSGPEHGRPEYEVRDGGSQTTSEGGSPVDRGSEVRTAVGKTGPGKGVQVMVVEGLDDDAFPIPLRTRKGKEPVGTALVGTGMKRKR